MRRDRAALKRLQKSGTFRGKIDLRKAPTLAQLKRIAELKPAHSKKTGKRDKPLPPTTKAPGAKIARKRMSRRELERDASSNIKLTTYALPFLRKGRPDPEWRRFTREQLKKFLAEYKAGDEEGAAEWREYAVRETWTFNTKTERSTFRRETDLYFSGVRVAEPQGGSLQRRAPNKKYHRGRGKK